LKNTNNVVITIASNRSFYTLDGGKAWSESKKEGGKTEFGDPALVSDGKGNFLGFHFSRAMDKGAGGPGVPHIVYQASEDEGKSWTPGLPLVEGAVHDQARPRVSVHPIKKEVVCITWTELDSRDTTGCHSNIFFSESPNDGKRWSQPRQINQIPGDCTDGSNMLLGTAPVLNADGKLFVAWFNQGVIFFDRSYDGGQTWLGTDLAIGRRQGTGSMNIPGFNRSNSLPVLAIDNSNSFHRGSLYLVWADQSNGEQDADIWFMRSSNRGDLWSQPKRVNQDGPGKQQFFPWIAVDEATGVIYIVYHDRRAYDDLRTDVYVAYSVDGGLKFKEIKVNENPFVPSAQKPLSDHAGIAAFKGVIAPVWTSQDEHGASLWTALLKQEDYIKKEDMPRFQQIRTRPPH
jgi:hypothetical protein